MEHRGGNNSGKSNRSDSPSDVANNNSSSNGKAKNGSDDGGGCGSDFPAAAMSPSLVDQLRRASPFPNNGTSSAVAAAIAGNLSPPATPISMPSSVGVMPAAVSNNVTAGTAATTTPFAPSAAAALTQAMAAMQQVLQKIFLLRKKKLNSYFSVYEPGGGDDSPDPFPPDAQLPSDGGQRRLDTRW